MTRSTEQEPDYPEFTLGEQIETLYFVLMTLAMGWILMQALI